MDKQELIDRFDEGGMFGKCFAMLADASPKMAEDFLCCYEGVSTYNNYASESEALKVVASLTNEDGTTGGKWTPEVLFSKVESLGGATEEEPYYNKWALYVAMNMENSDHASVLKKWSEGDADKYAEACYDLAVGQLKDIDNEHWLRDYFKLG